MRIINSQEHGPLSEDALIIFEQFVGARLPDEYREFLLEHNGGSPEPKFTGGSDVNYLFGVHRGPYHTNAIHHIKMFNERIPEGFIPVGSDSGGNIYCLSVARKDRGSIFFWNHEFESDYDEKPTENNMKLLNSSFSEFLNSLIEVNEE